MIRTLLEEDLDEVAGSGRRSGHCWKWKRIWTLLEVEEDPDAVAGSGRGSGRCWKRIWT